MNEPSKENSNEEEVAKGPCTNGRNIRPPTAERRSKLGVKEDCSHDGENGSTGLPTETVTFPLKLVGG